MSWVKPETHKDRLISMIAICGEMPVDQLTRLPGGNEYIKKRKPPACSQTSRATNCATPRSVKNIRFLGHFP